jgi:spore coat protein H
MSKAPVLFEMKLILRTIVLLLLLSSCVDDPIPVDQRKAGYVYDTNALPDVQLTITVDEWNKLLSYYDQNPYNEENVAARMTFSKNGVVDVIDTVGLRLRGNTSRRRPEGSKGEIHNSSNPNWHHASFSVDINRFVPGQRFAGLKKINLKWFKDDAMYVREIYCYDLFERFGVWTAPQSGYCRLFLRIGAEGKRVYFGVYQLLEAVDTEYLTARSQRLGKQQGFLWKANWGANFRTADRSKMDIEQVTLTKTYEPVYDLKNRPMELETARDQLAEFIASYNSLKGTAFKEWVVTRMDVPLFLKTYAVNVLCGMWDDYWNNQNNFYFYFDASGKFYFIPFDYDNTLGTSMLMTNSGTRDLLNWGDSRNPLVVKLLEIPDYRALYINYLHELTDPARDLFDYERSRARILQWHALIGDHITNDTGEDMEIKDLPASWGNCGFYRLLEPTNNFFKIRSANLPAKTE